MSAESSPSASSSCHSHTTEPDKQHPPAADSPRPTAPHPPRQEIQTEDSLDREDRRDQRGRSVGWTARRAGELDGVSLAPISPRSSRPSASLVPVHSSEGESMLETYSDNPVGKICAFKPACTVSTRSGSSRVERQARERGALTRPNEQPRALLGHRLGRRPLRRLVIKELRLGEMHPRELLQAKDQGGGGGWVLGCGSRG